jgi:hypothetical protein
MYKVKEANTAICIVKDDTLLMYDINANPAVRNIAKQYGLNTEKDVGIFVSDQFYKSLVKTLVGKIANLSHKADKVVGKIIDVVQNTDGIESFDGATISNDDKYAGKYFAIVKFNNNVDPAVISQVYSGTSTQYRLHDMKFGVPKEKINGYDNCLEIIGGEYHGLAMVNSPRSTDANLIINSSEEKKLDNKKELKTLENSNFLLTKMDEEKKAYNEDDIKQIADGLNKLKEREESERLANEEKENREQRFLSIENRLKNMEDNYAKAQNSTDTKDEKDSVDNEEEKDESKTDSVDNEGEDEKKDDDSVNNSNDSANNNYQAFINVFSNIN